MQIINLEQGSEEWLEYRLGKVTGTRLGSIWSARQYTKDDVVKLLEGRQVEFKKSSTKAVLEELLTEEDKEILASDSEKKLEYYQILADQVAVAVTDEVFEDGSEYYSAMDRGTGLENVAADLFAEKFGKDLMVVGCCASDADPRIIQSPDRLVTPKGLKIEDLKFEDGKIVLPKNKKITEAVEVKCLGSAKHLMAFFEKKVPEDYWTQKVQYFVVNPDLKRLYWVFYDPRIPMLPMFALTIEREDLGHWPETMLKYQMRTLKELDALTVRLFEESDNILLPAKAEKV